jgi:hypothetical protein
MDNDNNIDDNYVNTQELKNSEAELTHQNGVLNTTLNNFFNVISANEQFDMSSFDYLPNYFHNLDTKLFGSSNNNNFLKLCEVAKNININYQDRFQAIRYLQRIPYNNKYKYINECINVILNDYNIPFNERYLFFSNNERIIKLDYEILNYCHLLICRNIFDNNLSDVIGCSLFYKILSCQYILGCIPNDNYDCIKLQNYLLDIANDESTGINYRSECSDILYRLGYINIINDSMPLIIINYKNKGLECINKLGSLYVNNKISTIYNNSQNVHDESINNIIINNLNYLISNTFVGDLNTGKIYEDIINTNYYKNLQDNLKHKVINSFQRLILDGAKYEGRSMLDITLIVYSNILNNNLWLIENTTTENTPIQDTQIQLQNRFIQELIDMDDTCSSGHLSRLINILNGYINFKNINNIGIIPQLKSNIYARLTRNLKDFSGNNYDNIINEMTSNEKPLIDEFLSRFSPYEELKNEFTNKYIQLQEFDKIFNECINDYFGYTN